MEGFIIIIIRLYFLTLRYQGAEGFGFSVKGGEKKKGTNEQWLVYHYTTPIFISHILPGGAADR